MERAPVIMRSRVAAETANDVWRAHAQSRRRARRVAATKKACARTCDRNRRSVISIGPRTSAVNSTDRQTISRRRSGRFAQLFDRKTGIRRSAEMFAVSVREVRRFDADYFCLVYRVPAVNVASGFGMFLCGTTFRR